jgi:hypothetical protein
MNATSFFDVCLFIYGLFNDAFSRSDYTASDDKMINEWSVDKHFGWICRGLFQDDVPAFALRDWGKPLKTAVRIACLRVAIWTQDFLNTKKVS